MDGPRAAFERPRRALGTDYLDLYLIHWPRPDLEREDWKELDVRVWACLEELYQQGKVRAIGTSNFLPHHLNNLAAHGGLRPMVDQLEFHPGYAQAAAVQYCQDHHIQVEAWSPLGRRRILEDPQLREMAAGHQATVPQICLSFALQSGVLPLPKSSNPERMRENLAAQQISLTEEELWQLRTMPQVGWSGEHPDRERVRI